MYQKLRIYTLLILSTFLLSLPILAKDGEKNKKKPNKEQKAKKFYTDFTEDYYETKSQFGNNNIEALRAKAKNSVNEMEAQQRYIDYLAPSDLNKLPIGFKKQVGNTKIKIAISSAVFTPNYAELTAYAKIEIPQNNNSNGSNTNAATKTIFFGISGLKLAKEGGIIGDARLVLLGDYAIKLGGNNSSLILKGGMDMNTGQATGKTYLTLDCNGFKKLGIAAAIEFPRSLLEPLNANGDVLPTGQVRGDFSLEVSNWNDILTDINLPPFQVKGMDGIGFKVENAIIDLSDLQNNPNIVYPQGYQQKYLGNDPTTFPLWRGVYAKNIKVTLPKSFANRDSSNRVAFGTENLIIDNNGISGIFYGENIIKLNKGSAGGWQFSLDSIRVAFEANRLLRAGFGGRIGLPINKNLDSDADVLDSLKLKNRYLAYSGVFSSVGDYLCRVITKDSIAFDVWKGSVLLKPNSYIELKGNKTQFKPSAMLNGEMNISSKTSTSGAERTTKILDFKGVVFQNLLIKTEAPYLSAQYFGINGSIKLGPLPITIDSIGLKAHNPGELGLGFNLKVNLQDGSFSGKTRLHVIGKYLPNEQGLAKWKYERLKVEDISIDAEIGKMRLSGSISFLDDDPTYGDGFRGNMRLRVPMMNDSLVVTAAAVFGNKGFRYWFVDGLLEFPGNGIPLGTLNINGFGGGAYYRMKKNGFDPTLTPTGFEYVPDSTAGLGLRASVLFNIANKKLDHGQATFEIAFNRGGGMRYIGFYGFVKIQAPLKIENLPGGNALTFIKDQYKKVEDKMKNMLPTEIEDLCQKKIFNPSAGAKQQTAGTIPASFDAEIRAVLGISYDFNNRILHANFDLYVSTPGNLLTGIGEGGRAGWAVLHVEPSKWYMHMGTPTDPIGLKIGVGPISAQTTAYFMIGHDLPAFPPLPGPIQAIINRPGSGITYQSNIGSGEKNDIKDGKGIAFGAGVHVSTGDISFLILYANFQAGMGFDVMIKDYSNYVCEETGQTPGFNGWYAKGRVYAYLQGEAGIRIKLGPIRKKIPIIKAAAVALLEARLPKPSWFGGLFHISASILGGKIKVKVNLKFSFGSNCTLQQIANTTDPDEIDFDEFKVVTSASPSNNTQDVSVYARPVLTCSTKPNMPFTINDSSGYEETFRPHLTSIEIKKGAQIIPAQFKISNDGSKITVYPDSGFSPLTDYVMTTKITYQRLVSGNWVDVTENGTAAEEVTTVNFKTGQTPPFIADENIGFMYPYKNQKFYHKNESQFGRVLLTVDRNDLFATFQNWKAKFIDLSTNQPVGTTDVTYNGAQKIITFPNLQLTTATITTVTYPNEVALLNQVPLTNYSRLAIEPTYEYPNELPAEESPYAVPEEVVEPEYAPASYFSPTPVVTTTTVVTSATPFLQNNKSYRVEIYGVGYIQNTLLTDTTKAILSIDFKTSNFGTLQEKINSLQVTQPIVGRIESDVIDLQAKVNNYEGFDIPELVPTSYSGNAPLVLGEALLDQDDYYNYQIKGLMNYNSTNAFFPAHSIFTSRPVSEIGIIPYRAISTSNFYLTSAQSPNYSTALTDRFPFIYDVNRVFNIDFIDLRTKIINKYLSNITAGAPTGPMYIWVRPRWYLPKVPVMTQEWRNYFNSPAYQQSINANTNGVGVIPTEMRPIVTSPFPFMPQGIYKAKFTLRLPTSWNGPDQFNYMLTNPGYFNYNNPIQ